MDYKEKILEIIELSKNEIDLKTFNLIINLINDNLPNSPGEIGNKFSLLNWVKHYQKNLPNITEEQLKLMLDFLKKYHKNYIEKRNEIYFVEKRLIKPEETYFETIIFETIHLLNQSNLTK